MDNKNDCPHKDDEDLTQMIYSNLTELLRSHFKCEIANNYIHQSLVQNGECECKLADQDWCEDEDFHIHYVRKNISFPTICDEFTELIPKAIDGQNETDETECEQWSCNNIYTRCDGLWNCPRGEDEIGCDVSSTLNCSADHHKCVSPDTTQLICLSIEKANDGKIDCLGATDEPTLCQTKYQVEFYDNFYCMRGNQKLCISSTELCDGYTFCDHDNDDEKFCVNNRSNEFISGLICDSFNSAIRSDVEQFLCHETKNKIKQQIKYFSLDRVSKSEEDETKNVTKPTFLSSSIIKLFHLHEPRCHRGFDLRISWFVPGQTDL
ncbi:unnamed protein product [Rotaria sp. Silwood2]|nr:unnamed protein product [Rotaria sp. Silwood2]